MRRIEDDSEDTRAAPDSGISDAETLASILDGIPGAHERAALGLRQARTGETIPLDELSSAAGG